MTVIILIPIIINIIMCMGIVPTSSELHSGDWLSFWGNFFGGTIGGLGTLIAIYFTIKYYEKQNADNMLVIINQPTIIKIDEILLKIAERKTIENGLFQYSDKLSDVKEIIGEYNQKQGLLLSHFTNVGITIFEGLYNFKDEYETEYQKYYNLPKEIVEKGKLVGQKALYENCIELLEGDPEIGRILNMETGGSCGVWHQYLHARMKVESDWYIDELELFFELIPKLVEELETIKKSLMS